MRGGEARTPGQHSVRPVPGAGASPTVCGAVDEPSAHFPCQGLNSKHQSLCQPVPAALSHIPANRIQRSPQWSDWLWVTCAPQLPCTEPSDTRAVAQRAGSRGFRGASPAACRLSEPAWESGSVRLPAPDADPRERPPSVSYGGVSALPPPPPRAKGGRLTSLLRTVQKEASHLRWGREELCLPRKTSRAGQTRV